MEHHSVMDAMVIQLVPFITVGIRQVPPLTQCAMEK